MNSNLKDFFVKKIFIFDLQGRVQGGEKVWSVKKKSKIAHNLFVTTELKTIVYKSP